MDQKTRHVVANSALTLWAVFMLALRAGVKMSPKLPSLPASALAAVMPIILLGFLFQPLLSTAAEAPSIDPMTIVGATTLMKAPSATAPESTAEPNVEVKIEPKKGSSATNPTATKTFKAVVTQYSRADSCHNKKNGLCLMASGKAVYAGAVACPTFLKLGTHIALQGKIYTCEDRYATRLDTQRGLPTIDVFVEANARGRAIETIYVL